MTGRLLGSVVGMLLASATLGTSLASADGLPVLGVEGSSRGVGSPANQVRYVTRPAGRDTRVLGLSADGSPITRGRLPGRLVVPVVAYDGSPGGLSADGHTLVLIRPRVAFPQPSTNLVILNTRAFQVRSRLRLRGDFSFDAISPNGRWIYLIQYTSARDPTRYRVRALNVLTGRLLARDIVDPRERGEAMRGNPLTRTSSRDGRWAYTLYDGDGHPFVHALDTTGQTARCIDVPALDANSNLWATRLRLSPDRAHLLVTLSGQVLATIDTRTFAVSYPAPVRRLRPTARVVKRGSVGAGLPLAGIIAVLAGATLFIRRRLTRD